NSRRGHFEKAADSGVDIGFSAGMAAGSAGTIERLAAKTPGDLADGVALGVREESGSAHAGHPFAGPDCARFHLRAKWSDVSCAQGAGVDAVGIGFLDGYPADPAAMRADQTRPVTRVGK